MLTAKEVSKLLDVTPHRVKQQINEMNWSIYRSSKTSPIKIPSSTVRNLINSRDLTYNNPKVVTIASEKGGVGKTFLTTNTAIISAARGMKVCLLDFDPEACATNTLIPDGIDYKSMGTMLEVFTRDLNFSDVVIPSRYENLDLVPCKAKARRAEKLTYPENPKKLVSDKIKKLKETYDLILLDLPPNFSTLTAACYLASDLVIQPCFPNIYSVESIELTNDDIKEACEKYDAKVPEIKILLNAFRSTEKASRETRHVLEDDFKDHLLPFEIGKYQDVSNLINEGQSVIDVKTKATADLLTLVDYLCPVEKRLQ